MSSEAKKHTPHVPGTKPVSIGTKLMRQYVIISHATKPLDATLLTETRDALDEFVNGPLNDVYGSRATFRIGTSPTDRGPNEIAINLRDSIPDAPGALAYHSVTNGVPDIELGLDVCTHDLKGADSLPAVLSHEVAETECDPGANEWADYGVSPTTGMRAKEASDRVQNTSFQSSKDATLSNFLLPSAFIPGAPAPWDYMSMVTGKALMANQLDYSNGYDIEASEPSKVSQLQHAALHFGGTANVVTSMGHESLSDMARARKRSPYSRTARRGARI
jgi:hypothetical protein